MMIFPPTFSGCLSSFLLLGIAAQFLNFDFLLVFGGETDSVQYPSSEVVPLNRDFPSGAVPGPNDPEIRNFACPHQGSLVGTTANNPSEFGLMISNNYTGVPTACGGSKSGSPFYIDHCWRMDLATNDWTYLAMPNMIQKSVYAMVPLNGDDFWILGN